MKTPSKSVLFAVALVMFLALAMTAFLGLSSGVDVAGAGIIPNPFTDHKTVAGANNSNHSSDGGEDGYAIAAGGIVPEP